MNKSKSHSGLRIGLVGATGLVGKTFLRVLAEQTDFEISELRLFASQASHGRRLLWRGRKLRVGGLHEEAFDGLDVLFFSGGDDLSATWAPQAAKKGVWVIDNSATFRMHPDVSLVVPEVNAHVLQRLNKPQIIANPNCTTIQLAVVLNALKELPIEQVHVASYQAASGAGRDALEELKTHSRPSHYRKKDLSSQHFARSLAYNVVPQIGALDAQGFSSEEMKIIKETKKILGRFDLKISAFCVRVPVINAHSEVTWVRFGRRVVESEIAQSLRGAPGLSWIPHDGSQLDQGLTPREVSGRNDVVVGRVHADLDDPQQWIFWSLSDNLRKGAAYNGFQILKQLWAMR
ncbi:MAG: aspartate-semialdehyde dehydrogenase [Bdellovibrionaceae bacterium]|jgi:aspartate-semialdehyde dehydrogenase|nr:aspartate-semialdehyde dehydrogenase [Pseudobdellovibrionaceae bacterium]